MLLLRVILGLISVAAAVLCMHYRKASKVTLRHSLIPFGNASIPWRSRLPRFLPAWGRNFIERLANHALHRTLDSAGERSPLGPRDKTHSTGLTS